MAIVTTYSPLNRVKEDVSERTHMLAPNRTAFTNTIGSEKISTRTHEWTEDKLRAPAENRAVEGADASFAAKTQPVSRTNNTQIFEDSVMISGSAEATALYGRASEEARLVGKMSKELKQDVEYAQIGSGQAAALGSASVGRAMAGVQAQIDESMKITAANGLISKNDLHKALRKLHLEGGEADRLLVKAVDAEVVSTWALDRDYGLSKEIVDVVNVIRTPHGDVKVHISLVLKETDALVYSATNWKRLIFRNWEQSDLARTGDATKTQIVGEFSLKHISTKASALITGLTNTNAG